MKREAPTERDIANLLATAFERMPEPDARRLAAIEQQLLAQPRLHGRKKIVWWWLIGALVAGAASAMWWAMDYDSDQGQGEPVPGISTSPATDRSASPGRSESAETSSNSRTDRKTGPMIYQRER